MIKRFKLTLCALLGLATSTVGAMEIGTNFWFLASWSGEAPFKQNVNWSTAYANGDDIWDPTFIDELAPYTLLRFMDWGATNHSKIENWSQRRLPNDPGNASIGYIGRDSALKAGLAYEWMIDLSNRTGKDLWICLPHRTNQAYWTNLAQLIHANLDPSLKVYVEYSNETWNGGFSQYAYTVAQGQSMNLPGMNEHYQGGAYSVLQSIRIFKAFEDVFGSQSHRLVKVVSAMGNLDIARKALNNILYSSTWNPHGVMPDAFAIAPYVGGNLNGADPNIVSAFRALTHSRENTVIEGQAIADTHNLDYITYEGGQHILNNAHIWSANPAIYDEYIYMLELWEDYFSVYTHYTHAGNWASDGAWGAKAYTGQPIADAHKYRAIVDYAASNGGGGPGDPGGPGNPGGGTEVIIDNSDARFTNSGFWGNQTWGSGFWGDNWHCYPASVGSGPSAAWTIDFSGTYEIQVRAGGGHLTTNQPFRVVHANGTTNWMSVDMAGNAGNWVSLGSFTVNASSRVETHSNYNPSPSGNRAIADAVRFVPTSGGGTGGGSVSLNPTADRDTQSANSGTNTSFYASQYNTILLKFDLGAVNGPVSEAVLRIYKPSSSAAATVSVRAAQSDNWTETGTSTSHTGANIDTTSASTAAQWVELDVTALVAAEAQGDGIVTLAIRTDLSSWTAFRSRESNEPPELEVIW